LWDTTARYHVWPWPWKFAVVTNTPAFLTWALISWPASDRWPTIPEAAMAAPSLLFAAILWYAVGSWFDQRWGAPEQPATRLKLPWILLLLFTLMCVCAVGASIHSTTAYLLWGVTVWLFAGLGPALSKFYRRLRLHA